MVKFRFDSPDLAVTSPVLTHSLAGPEHKLPRTLLGNLHLQMSGARWYLLFLGTKRLFGGMTHTLACHVATFFISGREPHLAVHPMGVFVAYVSEYERSTQGQ